MIVRALTYSLLAFLVFGALAFLAVSLVAWRFLWPKKTKPQIDPVRPLHRP